MRNLEPRPRIVLVLLLGAGLAVGLAAGAGEYAGSETCAGCHEEVARDFQRSAHAKAPGWDDETGCESCHGPAAEHAEAGGDPEMIRNLADLGPSESSAVCLDCHRRQEMGHRFGKSLHGRGDVACGDCHAPHSTAENMLETRGVDLCAGCHRAAVAQFALPRSHPLAEEDEGCTGCHNPHDVVGLRASGVFSSETCYECHIDKRGPFLYPHDIGIVDGCAACHTPHGSTNRHLLNHERQINLCYQCHTGAQTPGFHSAPSFLNEKCSACHTAIHGSNTNPFFLEE